MPYFAFVFILLRALSPLHSFPTRRSSDLEFWPWLVVLLLLAALGLGAAYWFTRRGTKRAPPVTTVVVTDRKSTRLNSSHPSTSYAVFCLKKKKQHRDASAIAIYEDDGRDD